MSHSTSHGRRVLAAVALVFLNSACTTMRPTHVPSAEIQSRILAGDLLAPGDRVRLATKDGTVHELRIASVDLDRGVVTGADDAVPIAEIVAVEKRELSWVKTGILIGGLVVTLGTDWDCDYPEDPFCAN